MSKKWYNYIVSVDDAAGTESDRTNVPPNTKNAPATARSAAQSVAEIASSIAAEPKFTTPVSDPTSFEEIYKAAEIPPAPQGLFDPQDLADAGERTHSQSAFGRKEVFDPGGARRCGCGDQGRHPGCDTARSRAGHLRAGAAACRRRTGSDARIKRTATFRRRSISM